MLVRLLISLEDRSLAAAFGDGQDDTVAVDVGEPGDSLTDLDRQNAPDLILADSRALGATPEDPQFGQAIAALRGDGDGANLIYLTRGSPAERAAAQAAGCLAVLDAAAPVESLIEATRAVLQGWRDRTLQMRKAEQGVPPLQFGDFISVSPAMEQMIQLARKVAVTNSSVLILGETGVGKELLASALHTEGPRCQHPFVVVNCGAIPETLIESELFGHEKGAFTGAHRAHRGYFEMAHGGTILLDEIGELPAHLQVKLLRVLQERQIQRVGAESGIDVDVRVLAATNRDLKEEIVAGRFRSDLYYRIGVVTLTIPPLRDRREDIPLMAQTYLDRLSREAHVHARRISASVQQALQNYGWPGNIREVANVIERATLLCEAEEIGLEDLPEEIAGALPGAASTAPSTPTAVDLAPVDALSETILATPLRQAKRVWLESFERSYLDQLLRATRGRISETATRAGIDPRSLYDKMRRLGLRKEDYKE